MHTTCTRVSSAVLLLIVSGGAMLVAKDRIFVDQWSPTRSDLYIADADGTSARKLVAGSHRDYNASFSFDGQWVVFTSERYGSADIFRVRTDGIGLERLTAHLAYDDQAALSPSGSLLAFVSTRETGSTDIYILNVKTGEIRNLTNAAGGDFRPSWSPDGQMLAFTSDRGTKFQKAEGRWEHVHAASVYIMGVDGRGLRKLSPQGRLGGSPKWSPDGKRVVFYELDVADTFKARWLPEQSEVESRIVSIDVATGSRLEHASGPGLKLSPQFLGPDRVGYLEKSGPTAALAFSPGQKGSAGDIGNPAWSHDGRRLVYQRGPIATIAEPRAPGGVLHGRDPQFELLYASGFPAVSTDGQQLVVSERTGRGRPRRPHRLGGVEYGRDESKAHFPSRRLSAGAAVVVGRSVDRVRRWQFLPGAHPSGAGDDGEARRFGSADPHHRTGQCRVPELLARRYRGGLSLLERHRGGLAHRAPCGWSCAHIDHGL